MGKSLTQRGINFITVVDAASMNSRLLRQQAQL